MAIPFSQWKASQGIKTNASGKTVIPFSQWKANQENSLTPKSIYDTGNVLTSPILLQPKGGSFAGALARSPVNVPTSVARNVSSVVAPVIEKGPAKFLSDTVSGVAKTVSGGLQEAMGSYQSMITGKTPKIDNESTQTFDSVVQVMKDRYGSWENIKRTIAEDPSGFAFDISMALEGGGTGLKLAGEAGKFEKVAEVGAKTAELGRTINPVRLGAKATVGAVNKVRDFSLEKNAINDWTKPTTINKPSFNKATDIFKAEQNRGHNISETLVKNKINPSDHIEGGQYNTADTADKLREDAGKLSSDLLRPSLERASYSVPVTPVDDVVNSALSDIKGNKYLTAEEKASISSKLEATRVGLKKQYPKGMSLVDLHDEKILRGTKVKRSPIGDPATNIEAQKNETIRDTLMTMVEKKSPSEIPVGEFNAELRKQYRAADYLDSLQSKKAPVGLVSKVAKTTAKVIGAAVGHGLGGGILGGVGGYHIGGMVESMIEELPNPIKSALLQNLEITNQPVFQQIKNIIGEQEMAKLTTKALPPPSKMGTAERPFITPAPTTFEKSMKRITPEEGLKALPPPTGSRLGTQYNPEALKTTPPTTFEKGVPKAQSPKSLETKGAVAAPISNMSKNSIETNTATKGKTFQESLSNKTNPLLQEAKKYKSAEEFVKAQGTPVLHGTADKFDTFGNDMKGSITGAQSAKGAIWFTPDEPTAKAYSIYASESGPINKLLEQQKVLEKIAQKSGSNSDWAKVDKLTQEIDDLGGYEATYQRRIDNANVKEAVVNGDFMVVDAKGKTPQEMSKDGDIDSWLNTQLEKGKKMGKDGVLFKNLDDAVGLSNRPADHYAIFDSKNIKTKSQLTDIWNKANKK